MIGRLLAGGLSRGLMVKIGAGLGVVIIALTGAFSYRACVPRFLLDDGRAFAATLAPLSADTSGVALDSGFVLTLGEPVPAAAIKSALTIHPETGFGLKQTDQDGKVFRVTPETPLKPDQVYRFSLALAGPTEPGFSWAYQTTGEPRVVGTLPGHGASWVPVNTGIEIEFSHPGMDDPAAFFTISPPIAGRWERHRRTMVFVPTSPLRPATIYTCTVKSGLAIAGSAQALTQDYVFSFETEPAGGGAGESIYFEIYGEAAEFAPSQRPHFPVSYSRYYREDEPLPAVRTEVYRYVDAAAYVAALLERDSLPTWASLARREYQPPVTGLHRALQADLQIHSQGWERYIVLPEPLPVGFYLASFRVETITRFVWFQVTDLSSYVVAAADDTVLWFNSLASGRPVGGVVCRPVGPAGAAALATSGADGLARFKTPPAVIATPSTPGQRTVFYVVNTAPGGSESVVSLHPGWDLYGLDSRQITEAYWSYLFTDRPLYLPSDKVHFWGLVQPIEAGTRAPAHVTITLHSYSGYVWDGPFSPRSASGVILSQEATLRGHTFSGSVTLPNLRPGYYRLELSLDGVALTSQPVEVATYTKPAYRIDLSASKRAVFTGDPVDFVLTAHFFEGTPVSELKLDSFLSFHLDSRSGTLTTGVDGRAVSRYTPRGGDDPLRLQRWDSFSVSANLPEAGAIWANTGVRVFEKDTFIQVEALREGGSTSIKAQVNRVTLDRLNADDTLSGWVAADYTGAPVAGAVLSGAVYHVRHEARETGEYYDYIEKLVRKTYEYHEVRDLVQEFTLTTGASGEAVQPFSPDPNKTYLVHLAGVDAAGRPIAAQVFVFGRTDDGDDQEWQWFHLAPSDRDAPRYAVGETVNLAVRERDRDVAPRFKGFLFYTARQGLKTVEVKDDGQLAFAFAEAFIPNTTAGGAYFDGRSYHDLGNLAVRFDYRPRTLEVTVTTDRETYGPGGRVVIAVECRDAGGRPAAAEVNLCLVDEALFQLRGQSVNTIDSIYGKYISSGVFLTHGSHPKRLMGGGGAEQGGEGGGERRDFRDTALFTTVNTGSDGRATAEVVLPDNLTSWRLTYQAFASGVRAGSGVLPIVVRLPFFVELTMNETYLAGDRPAVGARAYGGSLDSGAAVEFSARLVRITGEATSETVTEFKVQGTAFRPSALSLGELAAGRYELTVTGRATASGSGAGGTELRDTITRSFDVVDTYLKLDRADYYPLTENLTLRGEPGELVTLVFSDAERGRWLAVLGRLSGGGRRADMKAAAVVSARLLETYFSPEEGAFGSPPVTESDFAPLQRSEGGIALLPYADPDLELTAKISALGGSGFDRDGLRAYLGRVFDRPDETRERLIVALYGLGALDQPVLNEALRISRESDLSTKEKLYLTLALIELGDEETARALYATVKERHFDQIGPLARLKVSADQEEVIAATSLAAVIEARLRLPHRSALFEYLVDNVPLEELNYLELALYLEAVLPSARPGAVSFTIKPEGRKVTLAAGETLTVFKRSEELAAMSFGEIQGSVAVSAFYRGRLDLATTRVGRGEASLTRTYYVGGRETTVLKAGDLVKVVIGYRVASNAPEGPYQVVDFLPSGLKIVPQPFEFGVRDANLRFPAEVDGQKITFNIYATRGRDPRTGQVLVQEFADQVVYYARVVSTGVYQADPAVLQHVKSGEIFAATSRRTVEIR